MNQQQVTIFQGLLQDLLNDLDTGVVTAVEFPGQVAQTLVDFNNLQDAIQFPIIQLMPNAAQMIVNDNINAAATLQTAVQQLQQIQQMQQMHGGDTDTDTDDSIDMEEEMDSEMSE